MSTSFPVVDTGIADLRSALESGVVTSVQLTQRYLDRIAAYDHAGIRLNAVPVLNDGALAEAAESDRRRAAGAVLGPLDGVPYTAKDSFSVRGMTVSAGSPAFADLVAGDDAFVIARLRAAGAICLGLTTMPPMAAGGMQRGLHGRAESPYNTDYLTSSFGSGSSNGSGTATAASFGAFGLGEESWSSGRAPASHNGLVAYTPSRGVISLRGNWPLYSAWDVVVPHTRTVADLLEVLNVIVADDDVARGDFWRVQDHVTLPAASQVRPTDYRMLAEPAALQGKRLAVPRMYINADPDGREPVVVRESIMERWRETRRALEGLGAEIVETDFPVVSNYEEDRPGARSMVTRGWVPADFLRTEMSDLMMWGWNDFLAANGDPALSRLEDVDGAAIYPSPPGQLPDQYEIEDEDFATFVERGRTEGVPSLEEIPMLAEGLRGLERTRCEDLENWLDTDGFDAVVFPTQSDVGPSDSDVNPESAAIAWANGVRYSTGNLAIRHLGIPTVTVTMGVMDDTGMPVGLTIAGRAYDDNRLLAFAAAFESATTWRRAPGRTPELA
ncbi:amidase [Williamsia sterculiae]|uniref:Amidase n=1 Tax=Williamsia sterculiae TaxID=1344003 RepID=A0A1N7HGF7_9NOCA|nr:amidase [Williamsia sterculiae]SIS23977.1 amidase [Williamsia sterculiae]